LPDWLVGVIEPRTAVLVLAAIVVLAALVAGLFAGWIGAARRVVSAARCSPFSGLAAPAEIPPQAGRPAARFIDAMVRLITIGNSTQAAFQLAISTTAAPLRGHLERAASLVRAGVDLDRALHQTAANVRVEEMFLLASILGLGVRYGGRADLLLERVGNFMRDREQAEHELVAMSAETRLSAWILGCCRWAWGLSHHDQSGLLPGHVARRHRPHPDLFRARACSCSVPCCSTAGEADMTFTPNLLAI
jgi:tight adherence protein B